LRRNSVASSGDGPSGVAPLAANPPTFTYLDTCGRSCNSRGGSRNGQIHVISHTRMVKALTDAYGSGFVW
jgi:hypothetical protein